MNWVNKLLNFWGNRHGLRFQLRSDEKTLRWNNIKSRNDIGFWNVLGHTKILKLNDLPVKEVRCIFKVVTGVDQGREYVATSKEIRVGRHPENLILLRDPKASRFHAVIFRKGFRLILEDLGSTNGTRVNGEVVIKKRNIFSGDLIKIGETVIRVCLKKE